MNAIVKSGTPLVFEAHIHDTRDFALESMESSVSSQISRYSFVTRLIENEIDHETVDFSIVTSSGPFEFLHADYGFMVVPTMSSSNELLEFLAMIQ